MNRGSSGVVARLWLLLVIARRLRRGRRVYVVYHDWGCEVL